MREHARRLGFTPIVPRDVPWLSAADWPKDIVVSLDGKRVRIRRCTCGEIAAVKPVAT
jgi:hypothetical protein